MNLEYYLECCLVTTSSTRGRLAKCNDYPERRISLNKKKELYEVVAELALLH